MRELSLFSGAGGGLLASKYLLGWRTIGYVEWNEYCQKIIRQRIKDGLLDEAPIFGDIRTFISEGYAEKYRGLVDVVSGGFPCQPFSVAGKKKAGADERNMWPSTCQVIDIVKPSYAFLENVTGLVSCGYIGDILSDLAQIGYDAKWCCLSASDCQAPHKRERWWIFLEDTRCELWDRGKFKRKDGVENKKQDADIYKRPSGTLEIPNPSGKRLEGHREKPIRIQKKHADLGKQSWWESEPGVGRVANGVAHRVDRLKAIGNGQVPIVAATAWNILSNA
jgi:DNA (cytosine-5)-methyltransferase 1